MKYYISVYIALFTSQKIDILLVRNHRLKRLLKWQY